MVCTYVDHPSFVFDFYTFIHIHIRIRIMRVNCPSRGKKRTPLLKHIRHYCAFLHRLPMPWTLRASTCVWYMGVYFICMCEISLLCLLFIVCCLLTGIPTTPSSSNLRPSALGSITRNGGCWIYRQYRKKSLRCVCESDSFYLLTLPC